MWRLLTDPRLSVTKEEIEEKWSIDDVHDAHDALDFRDYLDWLAMPKPTP